MDNQAVSYTGLALGVIHLMPLYVESPVVIDQIRFWCGNNNNPSHFWAAIYKNPTTPEFPDGGILVVDTGSVAISGVNMVVACPIPDTVLNAGVYWIGIQVDDNFGESVGAIVDVTNTEAVAREFFTGGVYLPYPNPCPVTTVGQLEVSVRVRVRTNIRLI